VSRYVNPLPLESCPARPVGDGKGPDKIDIADPVVVRHEGLYYLYTTGGMAWVSPDLVNWKYHPVPLPEGRSAIAPHVAEHRGSFYMCGNTRDLFRSSHPLGPWECIGEFKDKDGNPRSLFDAMMFEDDDERVYMYCSGGSTAGIYGVELDPDDLTRFTSDPTHFFRFEPSHEWERAGDFNQHTEASWIEAPWMTKHEGIYYLQYSAPGTEWKTYAVGYYTGRRPLGPFTYHQDSPALVHSDGLINGVGHHCIIDTPDGSLWTLYNILYGNWPGRGWERRIGMDPVTFHEGNMVVRGPSETPRRGPGLSPPDPDDTLGDPVPLSVNQTRYRASSEAPGRDAQYALDNYTRTWWEASADDPQPSLMVDLSIPGFDETFTITASRILFAANRLKGSEGIVPGPYQYRIEASSDGETFATVVDKATNHIAKNVEYDEIPSVTCRYVRLTVTGAPPKVPLGIIGFTVFGRPASD